MTRPVVLVWCWILLGALAGCGDDGEAKDDQAVYGAGLVVGGLDRVVVYKASGGRCLQLRLVSPASNNDRLPGVTLPDGWSIETAWMGGTGPCDAQALAGAEVAEGGTGTVTFGAYGASGLPCSVDVDVTLEFYAGSERFARAAIPVSGGASCP